MKEINQCIESGCKADCCHDLGISRWSVDENTFKTVFPNAIITPNIEFLEHTQRAKRINNGIYYLPVTDNNGQPAIDFSMVGPCPHLTYGGNCRIHNKPIEYPNSCREIEINGILCLNCTERDDLSNYDLVSNLIKNW